MADESEAPVAEAKAEAPKTRLCLACHGAFLSEWSGERVCRRCKSKSGWRISRQAGGSSWAR